MFHVQRVERQNGYTKPSPVEFFKTTYDWLKNLGKIGASILIFAIISTLGFASGHKIVGILGIFYILSIIMRIPDTYQDMLYFESIATFGFLLTLFSDIKIALFFTITAEWLTKFISPFGDVEDYNETFSESVAVGIAIVLSPIFMQYSSGNLLQYMLYFQMIRFTIFYASLAITSPATIVTRLFASIVTIPASILQSYVILLLMNGFLFNLFGIGGWILPSLKALMLRTGT